MDQETKTPEAEATFPAAPAAQKSPLAMIVGVAGFIIVLLGVGWYAMSSLQMQQLSGDLTTATAPREQTSPAATDTSEDTAATALSTQGSSDDVTAIDADLKATDLDSLNDINKI